MLADVPGRCRVILRFSRIGDSYLILGPNSVQGHIGSDIGDGCTGLVINITIVIAIPALEGVTRAGGDGLGNHEVRTCSDTGDAVGHTGDNTRNATAVGHGVGVLRHLDLNIIVVVEVLDGVGAVIDLHVSGICGSEGVAVGLDALERVAGIHGDREGIVLAGLAHAGVGHGVALAGGGGDGVVAHAADDHERGELVVLELQVLDAADHNALCGDGVVKAGPVVVIQDVGPADNRLGVRHQDLNVFAQFRVGDSGQDAAVVDVEVGLHHSQDFFVSAQESFRRGLDIRLHVRFNVRGRDILKHHGGVAASAVHDRLCSTVISVAGGAADQLQARRQLCAGADGGGAQQRVFKGDGVSRANLRGAGSFRNLVPIARGAGQGRRALAEIIRPVILDLAVHMLNGIAHRLCPGELSGCCRDDGGAGEQIGHTGRIFCCGFIPRAIPIGERLIQVFIPGVGRRNARQRRRKGDLLQRKRRLFEITLRKREGADVGDPLRNGDFFQAVDHHEVAGDIGKLRILGEYHFLDLIHVLERVAAQTFHRAVDHQFGGVILPLIQPGRKILAGLIRAECLAAICNIVIVHDTGAALDGFHGGGIIAVAVVIREGDHAAAGHIAHLLAGIGHGGRRGIAIRHRHRGGEGVDGRLHGGDRNGTHLHACGEAEVVDLRRDRSLHCAGSRYGNIAVIDALNGLLGCDSRIRFITADRSRCIGHCDRLGNGGLRDIPILVGKLADGLRHTEGGNVTLVPCIALCVRKGLRKGQARNITADIVSEVGITLHALDRVIGKVHSLTDMVPQVRQIRGSRVLDGGSDGHVTGKPVVAVRALVIHRGSDRGNDHLVTGVCARRVGVIAAVMLPQHVQIGLCLRCFRLNVIQQLRAGSIQRRKLLCCQIVLILAALVVLEILAAVIDSVGLVGIRLKDHKVPIRIRKRRVNGLDIRNILPGVRAFTDAQGVALSIALCLQCVPRHGLSAAGHRADDDVLRVNVLTAQRGKGFPRLGRCHRAVVGGVLGIAVAKEEHLHGLGGVNRLCGETRIGKGCGVDAAG